MVIPTRKRGKESVKYKDLPRWLENDAAHHCVVEEKGDKKNLVKIPYDDDFNFLYYQRVREITIQERNTLKRCSRRIKSVM